MEEMEDPTEKLQENIHERAEHSRDRWSFMVALSTALMAVFAAMSSLLAGDNANEALIEQVKASDQWSYYQAKSIKAEIAAGTATILRHSTDQPLADVQATEKYNKEKEDIKKQAEEHEQASEFRLVKHRILARAVTLFQIAIAISAISILSRKRFLWFVSIGLALVGLWFLLQGTLF